jgi:hypothetical protein
MAYEKSFRAMKENMIAHKVSQTMYRSKYHAANSSKISPVETTN